MNGDKLVIELGAERYALDTALVSGIVSVERVPFLPGQSGFVSGIISLRNEPVTVIDLRKVFSADAPEAPAGLRKVIVVRDKNRLLGLDIGSSNVSFIWEEETKRTDNSAGSGAFISGTIGPEESPIRIINWTALFLEASRILSTEEAGG